MSDETVSEFGVVPPTPQELLDALTEGRHRASSPIASSDEVSRSSLLAALAATDSEGRRVLYLAGELHEVAAERDAALRMHQVQYERANRIETERAAAMDDWERMDSLLREAEDFRSEIALDAFTAPDADWWTILGSLRARIRDLAVAEQVGWYGAGQFISAEREPKDPDYYLRNGWVPVFVWWIDQR